MTADLENELFEERLRLRFLNYQKSEGIWKGNKMKPPRISKYQIRTNKRKKSLKNFMSYSFQPCGMFTWLRCLCHKGCVERWEAKFDRFLRFFLSLQLYAFIRTVISSLIVMAKLFIWSQRTIHSCP